MSHGPLPLPLHPSRRHHSNPCIDTTTHSCLIEQESLFSFPASTASSIHTHFHSSPRFKDPRFPHRLSSSSSSSSTTTSAEPLAPVPNNFKRWRYPRQPLFARRHSESDSPLSPASFILDQVDDRPSIAAAVAAPTASKLCTLKMLSSAKCASIDTQQRDAIDSPPSKRRRTMDLHCIEAPAVTGDDIDVDKEDKRKLIMWRAACAMAHAYVHRHDRHQHDLHQHNQHELSFHIPRNGHRICNVAPNDESKQVNGPLLEENNNELRRVTKHINNPLSSSSPSSKDGARASSMCFLSDVVCIDEVVNPTQAAEWFGTLFSSTSTLVS